jgi:2-methylisocitrate lyase-like PEP mutase family enzyme
VLIARTDARAPLGFAEAVERANRYAAAGADVIFLEAPQSLDEIARVPKEVDAPVMYNWVTGGHSPAVELEQLQEWGYAMAIIPGLLIGTVVRAMIQALARAGAPTPMSADLRSPAALFDTVGLTDWLAAADRYAHD